jgi:hypothetical protein
VSPAVSLVVLLALGLVLQACTALSMTTVPKAGSSAVTQRTAPLTLGAGQSGQATALCQNGEHLVSGGFASAFTNYFAAYNDIKELELHSYPSDANGTPPSAQGQAMPGWTVAVVNTSPSAKVITVYANCLSANTVATAVWSVSQYGECPTVPFSSQIRSMRARTPGIPASPRSACGVGYEVGCPVNTAFRTLTGGGWKLNAGDIVLGSYPTQDQGMTNTVWHVFAVPSGAQPGTAYAICASGAITDPLATLLQSPIPPNSPQCVGNWCGYQSSVMLSVACPAGQLLVGGGQFVKFTPANTSAILPNLAGKWTVGHAITYVDALAKSTYPTTLAIYGMCVSLSAKSVAPGPGETPTAASTATATALPTPIIKPPTPTKTTPPALRCTQVFSGGDALNVDQAYLNLETGAKTIMSSGAHIHWLLGPGGYAIEPVNGALVVDTSGATFGMLTCSQITGAAYVPAPLAAGNFVFLVKTPSGRYAEVQMSWSTGSDQLSLRWIAYQAS